MLCYSLISMVAKAMDFLNLVGDKNFWLSMCLHEETIKASIGDFVAFFLDYYNYIFFLCYFL